MAARDPDDVELACGLVLRWGHQSNWEITYSRPWRVIQRTGPDYGPRYIDREGNPVALLTADSAYKTQAEAEHAAALWALRSGVGQ